jgi:hypothetical protein
VGLSHLDGLADIVTADGTSGGQRKVYINTGSGWTHVSSWIVPDVFTTLTQMVASGAGVTLLPSVALPVKNWRGETGYWPTLKLYLSSCGSHPLSCPGLNTSAFLTSACNDDGSFR